MAHAFQTAVKSPSRSPKHTSSHAPMLMRQAALTSQGLLQPKTDRCACGGSCPRCREKLPLQKKLAITEPRDAYEQEADRVADEVLAAPAHSAVNLAPPRIQRFAEQATGQVEPAPPSVDQVLASPGRPLEPVLRQDMEQRFGHDFSSVRIHSGAITEQSARDVNAHAYTVGHDVVFGADRFAPGTNEGRRLIAHELTHVVQQSGASAMRFGQTKEKRGLSRGLSLLAHELAHTIQQSHSRPDAARLQRSPAPPEMEPKPLEDLEAVGRRVAKLAMGPKQAKVQAKLGSPRGPVLTVVRDMTTGAIFVGLNTGVPKNMTSTLLKNLEAHKADIASGKVKVIHTIKPGTHAEVNALNSAVRAREAATRTTVTDFSTFELHNVWIGDNINKLAAARCEHCGAITSGVSVTQSVYIAEANVKGKLSGELNVPQRGHAVTKGGSRQAVTTTTGEITTGGPKPGAGGTQPGSSVPIILETMAGFASKAKAVGGAGAVILAAQLSSLRAAEKIKALDALEKLQPEIEQHHADGRNVQLTVVGEVPNQIDIAAQMARVGDASQIVYFKEMYVSYAAEALDPDKPPSHAFREAYGESQVVDTEDWTFQEELAVQLGGELPSKLGKPRKGHHFEKGTLWLPAPKAAAPASGKGLLGVYKPFVVVSHLEGESDSIQTYGMGRALMVGPIGNNYIVEWTMFIAGSNVPCVTWPISGGDYRYKFIDQQFGKDIYEIVSEFNYKPVNGFDTLEEEATGTDLVYKIGSKSKWRAKILWVKQ